MVILSKGIKGFLPGHFLTPLFHWICYLGCLVLYELKYLVRENSVMHTRLTTNSHCLAMCYSLWSAAFHKSRVERMRCDFARVSSFALSASNVHLNFATWIRACWHFSHGHQRSITDIVMGIDHHIFFFSEPCLWNTVGTYENTISKSFMIFPASINQGSHCCDTAVTSTFLEAASPNFRQPFIAAELPESVFGTITEQQLSISHYMNHFVDQVNAYHVCSLWHMREVGLILSTSAFIWSCHFYGCS